MANGNDSRCWTCEHYGWSTQGSCDYYLNTGVRRGCPPGAECTRYMARIDRPRGKTLFGRGPAARRWESLEDTIRDMYEQGKSDAAIASALGVVPSTVSRWRRKIGLPAQNAREETET